MKSKTLTLLLLIIFLNQISAQTPTKLSSNQFGFIEGPVWDGSEYIYFADVSGKKIHKYSTTSNTFSLAFDNNTDGCNGLMFNKDYELIVCGFRSGNIAKRKVDGTLIETLFSEYNGSRFDNPNDLCIDKKGGIYFTDPTRRNPPFQTARRIYYITPEGNLTVADDGTGYSFPNGVIISIDGKNLFVNDSDSHDIYKYDINQTDGTISNKTIFANITNANDGDEKSRADGMAFDTEGNLYVTTKLTVQIFDKNGTKTGSITFPEQTTNCTFGKPDKKTLFVTATKNLYSVDLSKTGFQHPFDLPQVSLSTPENTKSKHSFHLFPNPSKNHKITVSVGSNNINEVIIYNELGQNLGTCAFKKTNNSIEVSLNENLKKDTYFLSITTEEGETYNNKVVLQ